MILFFLLSACSGGKSCGPWYADLDGDGVGGAASVEACEAPAGFVSTTGDCDDGDDDVNADANERCNGYDDDCDGEIDEDDAIDPSSWYADEDGDGYGDDTSDAEVACAVEGRVEDVGDCDDGDAAIGPDAVELCDGIDQDCDGEIDDEAADRRTWYADTDADGYGDPNAGTPSCSLPKGYTEDDTDCNDADPNVHPLAPTGCEADSDCDGLVGDDEPDATGLLTFFADADLDGWGLETIPMIACEASPGWVSLPGDCDDADADVNPSAPEVCAGGDEDCDGNSGAADDSVVDIAAWYSDEDGDGYGNATISVMACDAPPGFVSDATDCDDTSYATNPGGIELCSGGDEDCDGLEGDDDPDVSDGTTWYTDADGDTWGDPDASLVACSATGAVSREDDCDDTDAAVYPTAEDACEDGVDGDCYGGDQSCSPEGDWSIASADGLLQMLKGSAGYRVGAGDFDGDGYGDVASAAYEHDDVGPNAGAIGVFFGPATSDVYAETDGLVLTAVSEDDYLGTALRAIGDLDGDGSDELLAGGYYAGTDFSGEAYIVYGSTLAAMSPGDVLSLSYADATIPGNAAYDYMGDAAASLGDVDGDGIDDFALGAYGNSDAGYHAGATYIFSGAVYTGTIDANATALGIYLGEGSGSHSSGTMDSAGDFDGDGLDDLITGAEAEDHNGVLCGAAYVLLAPFNASGSMTDADLTMDGEAEGDLAGSWVAGAGDTNGDGYPDVLVGARANERAGFEAGAAFLILGPRSGTMLLDTADAIVEGPGEAALAGHALDGLGDMDGDGYDDIAVGAWRDSTIGRNLGSVAVGYGPLSGTYGFADMDWWIHGSGSAGQGIASTDTDGDGLPDLMIGGSMANTVWSFLGGAR